MAWHKLKPETKLRLAKQREIKQAASKKDLERRLKERSEKAVQNGEDDIWIEMLEELS